MKASIAALGSVGLLAFAAVGSAQSADLGGPRSYPAQDAGQADVVYPVSILGGVDVAKRSSEFHLGFYKALNGDLDRDGVIVRALGSFGGYEYGSAPFKFDGDLWQGDAMIGYQWVRSGFDFGVLVGVEYLNYQITPGDVTNPVRGTEFGFKTVLDLESNGGAASPYYFAARGSYSTAFDSYYALGRAGLNIGRGLFVGPEVWALGDKSGDAQRLGGFLLVEHQISSTVSAQFSASAGYQFADDKSSSRAFAEEGAYGTLRYRLAFGREVAQAAPLK